MSYQGITEEALNRICKYLVSKKPNLYNLNEDGRINSTEIEKQIIDELMSFSLSNEWFKDKNKFKIEKPKVREWYDFAITCEEDRDFFVPVNIKATNNESNADNISAKTGIYYALTGLIPSFPNGISWEKYFIKLKEDLNSRTDRDYYFLVINKDDRNDIFHTSIKTIHKLTPNGQNIPFQCNWLLNKERVHRNHKNAVKYILETFGESLKRRSNTTMLFAKYFPEYCSFSINDKVDTHHD